VKNLEMPFSARYEVARMLNHAADGEKEGGATGRGRKGREKGELAEVGAASPAAEAAAAAAARAAAGAPITHGRIRG
jgi:hypothetical protein